MTLEEKAKKLANSVPLRKDIPFQDYIRTQLASMYYTGAVENGIVWHDLRKNPDDLPETLHPVYAKLDSGTYVFAYCFTKWRRNDDGIILYHGNGECEVIAWCEIPRFEEE